MAMGGGYVGLYMAMYCYAWICSVVYSYIGLCMAMYGCVWACRVVYGYAWLCTSVWLCMAMYGRAVLQAATILVAMASKKNIWQLKLATDRL